MLLVAACLRRIPASRYVRRGECKTSAWYWQTTAPAYSFVSSYHVIVSFPRRYHASDNIQVMLLYLLWEQIKLLLPLFVVIAIDVNWSILACIAQTKRIYEHLAALWRPKFWSKKDCMNVCQRRADCEKIYSAKTYTTDNIFLFVATSESSSFHRNIIETC